MGKENGIYLPDPEQQKADARDAALWRKWWPSLSKIKPWKLFALADWIDIIDRERGERGDEVQTDLREWATMLVAAREAAGKEKS